MTDIVDRLPICRRLWAALMPLGTQMLQPHVFAEWLREYSDDELEAAFIRTSRKLFKVRTCDPVNYCVSVLVNRRKARQAQQQIQTTQIQEVQ
jgi:hypothetical protein